MVVGGWVVFTEIKDWTEPINSHVWTSIKACSVSAALKSLIQLVISNSNKPTNTGCGMWMNICIINSDETNNDTAVFISIVRAKLQVSSYNYLKNMGARSSVWCSFWIKPQVY